MFLYVYRIYVYRPPKGSIINFSDHINHCYAQLQKSPHNEIFILGDLNIDLAIPNDPNSKALKQLIKQIGCKQLINEPTHFNKQSKDSLLDLIITNSEKIIEVGTKDLNISDHELIYISRCHTSKPKEKLNFIGRSYRNYDKAAFIQKLKNSNWVTFGPSLIPNLPGTSSLISSIHYLVTLVQLKNLR